MQEDVVPLVNSIVDNMSLQGSQDVDHMLLQLINILYKLPVHTILHNHQAA